jgi:hypothetical protein
MGAARRCGLRDLSIRRPEAGSSLRLLMNKDLTSRRPYGLRRFIGAAYPGLRPWANFLPSLRDCESALRANVAFGICGFAGQKRVHRYAPHEQRGWVRAAPMGLRRIIGTDYPGLRPWANFLPSLTGLCMGAARRCGLRDLSIGRPEAGSSPSASLRVRMTNSW